MDHLATLVTKIAQHTDCDGVHPTKIPNLSLIRISNPTEPVRGVTQPSLCIVVQGTKHVTLADHTYEYGAGHHLVASVELPVVNRIVAASPEKPYMSLLLALDMPALGSMLMQMPRAAETGTARCGTGLCVSEASPGLLDAALRLTHLLDTPEDIDFLAPLAERELLYRLMRGEQAHKVRRMLMPESRLQQVNRAITWIRDNYDKPFSIDRVASEASMSSSSLHEHFREVTAMSPLQYQKQLRLQEARRMILAEALDAATAAHRVGYDSPSQFSREYRRLFGAPPIRDISRVRGEPNSYADA
ncbi:AraC family transcriptional regulator N-terminal domain-containing protein [Rhizobium panacihumi]|uniref:AraC family transcriptional regulator n=1 Tax=Rhizobium panacihumi TaxID=2008450 RepID=UPI003D793061